MAALQEESAEMRDYETLLDEARASGHFRADLATVELTAAMLGKMLVAAWAAEVQGRCLSTGIDLSMRISATLNEAPPEVLRLLHLEDRIDRRAIDLDALLAAAFSDGLLVRIGEGQGPAEVAIDRTTGEDILADYGRHPEAVAWARRVATATIRA